MKKFLNTLLALFIFSIPTFASDGNWSFSLTTDFAYYPQSDYVKSDEKSHFAPITAPYSGIELRTTANADYTIPTPLGDHWLVSDASVVLNSGLELSPVSLRPSVSASFTPLPFLVFAAGSSFGIGWNVLGFEGLYYLDTPTINYKPLNTFKNFYYDFWAQGTFQFDTGAIFSGDWTHVVMLANYQINYSGLTNLDKNQIYEWQVSVNKVQGLMYYSTFVLAYQMPLILYRAGTMIDLDGHFNSNDYGKYGDNFDGDFMSIAISPFVQLNLSQKDELYILAGFSSRRSFATDHTNAKEEPYLVSTGREWFFNRIAFSWTHRFN